MNIYCLPEFVTEFDKLIKNNSYSFIETEIIKSYFNISFEEAKKGHVLNASQQAPFIKRRLKGSGGARLYLTAILKDEDIYLAFVHPKSGSAGYENINDGKKSQLQKDVLDSILTKDFYKVSVNGKSLSFTPFKNIKEEVETELGE
ncbi:hypothetical protein FMM05_12880 [Flavobacterium zepuense]|uniref:Uncharacterized protein n=1 Tax=Flavobacterium zepuense TaxID=2593302 RepID=A0A552UZE3_9FLAO|nr:hypothetical protein [Flavobacterium zepuense]TRW23550.1 hypothetical protein FMM05_12880 [Flavobacterium zepuense]